MTADPLDRLLREALDIEARCAPRRRLHWIGPRQAEPDFAVPTIGNKSESYRRAVHDDGIRPGTAPAVEDDDEMRDPCRLLAMDGYDVPVDKDVLVDLYLDRGLNLEDVGTQSPRAYRRRLIA
jgi:hypothetical protein